MGANFSFIKSLAISAAIFLVALALHRRAAGLLFKGLRAAARRTRTQLPLLVVEAFERPASHFLLCLGCYFAAISLPFPSGVWFQGFCLKLLRIAAISLITWGVARLLSPETLGLGIFDRAQGAMSKTFCLFFSRILRVVVLCLGGVIIIKELGYDVNGLIAGIGLGGLTVALAAQDWAANLFGGVVILFDKPFAVDDWIQADASLEGVVEDITFRTTRIRTFDNSQIIVPNALLVGKPITNWSRMEKRKVSFDVGLTYDTPPEKLASCVEQIKALLAATAEVNQESFTVSFNEFGNSALNVRVHYFTNLTGYADYMRVKEHINYKVAEIVSGLGLSFAFPTQTLYLRRED